MESINNQRILENERLQMEMIRQLDMEELEIEEVEDYSHFSDGDELIVLCMLCDTDGGAGDIGGFTYDLSLASMHTYLGEVEDTQHRVSFLDGGAILNVPMFYLEGVVLFPEANLPLRVIQPRFKAVVEKALNQVEASHKIGVIHVHRHPDDYMLCEGWVNSRDSAISAIGGWFSECGYSWTTMISYTTYLDRWKELLVQRSRSSKKICH
ncbi:hypothetical protein MKW98_029429 [Papaver atlanticum]|uniref:Uncharacterized protein n=1 Tax=Papaver atlanticum TaxID=357466 RepID=A0AAD4XFU0_9MAGN|nr:hypothetical protein MKW98_029429 [Papaver atlanticum]